jgi:hypothetical protein
MCNPSKIIGKSSKNMGKSIKNIGKYSKNHGEKPAKIMGKNQQKSWESMGRSMA